MKLKTSIVREEILKLMDEDGISIDEFADITGISRPTIYAILKEKRQATQRSIARRIAETTNREFVIQKDVVRFEKKTSNTIQPEPDETEEELLRRINKLDEPQKQALLRFLDSLQE